MNPQENDRHIHKSRLGIERTFSLLKQFRRLAGRTVREDDARLPEYSHVRGHDGMVQLITIKTKLILLQDLFRGLWF